MRNVLASALVALLVSVAVSGAADQHPTHGISTAVLHRTSGPSDAQRIDALSKRVDLLAARLADTRTIAQTARTEADASSAVTACIASGVWMAGDTETADWTNGDGTEPDALLLATLDPRCAA